MMFLTVFAVGFIHRDFRAAKRIALLVKLHFDYGSIKIAYYVACSIYVGMTNGCNKLLIDHVTETLLNNIRKCLTSFACSCD